MSIESNSHISPNQSVQQHDLQPDDFDGASENGLIPDSLAGQQALAAISSLQSEENTNNLKYLKTHTVPVTVTPRALLMTVVAIAITFIGIILDNPLLGISGTVITLFLSVVMLLPWLQEVLDEWLAPAERTLLIGLVGLVIGTIGLIQFTSVGNILLAWGRKINWEASGTLAEWFGALGQILIAIIAVYIAYRQYIISKDLTIQQNLLTVQQNIITQQQTIDSYFQGISDLVLDDEGLLEDWPQERLLAEGRTAAIFSSVDGSGKAKILRFLSR